MVGEILKGSFEYHKSYENKTDRVNKIACDIAKLKALIAQTTAQNNYMINSLKALDNVLATCIENINLEVY